VHNVSEGLIESEMLGYVCVCMCIGFTLLLDLTWFSRNQNRNK